MDSTTIQDQVREHYGEIARRKLGGMNASCCGSSDVIPANAILEKDALPQQVVDSSLGCGTPLEIAKPQPGETVLDLGSGGGLDCFYASKQVGPAGRVIGVDMTPDMIKLATANAAQVGATNVDFRLGQLENLPVEEATVDVIISNCVINLAPDKDRVFQQAFRVLRPGGRVAVSDVMARAALPELVRASMAGWANCVSGAIPEEEYIAKMQAAGFVDVKKVSGGETGKDPVYSAKIVARKPGDVSRLPTGWGEKVAAEPAKSCCGG